MKRLTKAPGASAIEQIDKPGGGKRVRLTEPNGYQIEVVYGIAPIGVIPVKRRRRNPSEAPTARAGRPQSARAHRKA